MKKISRTFELSLLKPSTIGAAAILMAIASCKQPQQLSNTKSLDNFTSRDGAKLTYNSCSGSYAASAPEARLKGSAGDIAAIKTALTAVPTELQAAFFNDLQGSITIVKDISGACGGDKSGQRPDDMLACWRGSEAGIGVFIKGEDDAKLTERNIRHSVVRMMGYVLTDVILKVKKSGSDAEMTENPALAALKKDVADALTADAQKSKDYRIPESMKADQTKYHDAAFAEAFDSFYCSATSRSKMSASFPKTHDMFTEIAAVLPGAISGKSDVSQQPVAQAASQAGSSQSEFALWGRWGWGNGPIRQTFSNWSNYRANGGGFMNFRRWGSGGGFFFR